MVSTNILLALFFGHLLIDKCTFCPNLEDQCKNETISLTCRSENPVSNSTDVSANEGDDITLQCVTNPPNVNLTFGWKKDEALIPDQSKSELVLKEVLSDMTGSYSCVVNSTCCVFESVPCSVNVKNQSVILLVVCGVAALLLIVIMGLAMKLKLKRDNDKHRERRKQRGQGGQNGGPAPFTPRES